jgi:hypothetical protein
MAYVTTNPPVCLIPSMGSHSAVWLYKSEDVHTDVDATDYFTNGEALGMKVNDLVFVIKTTATVGATLHVVTAVDSDGNATVSAAILA